MNVLDFASGLRKNLKLFSSSFHIFSKTIYLENFKKKPDLKRIWVKTMVFGSYQNPTAKYIAQNPLWPHKLG